MSERILAFPAEILSSLPPIKGVSTDPLLYGQAIFTNPATTFIDREPAEKDPNWKQVIPYMLIEYKGMYLVYQRQKAGGESRLHNLYSLGFGGHIKDSDGTGVVEAYMRGMQRELTEEIEVETVADPSLVQACIYDDSSDVGKVHFGFVYVLRSASPLVKTVDPAVGTPQFMPLEFIRTLKPRFEAWSILCIDSVL